METQSDAKQGAAPADSSDRPARQCFNRHGHGHRRGGLFFTLVVALIAGLAGGYVGKSFAHGSASGWPGDVAMDPARIDARIDRMIDRLARRVDATPEQRETLAAIARGAAKDLVPLREKAQTARKSAIDLLAAPSVDRAGIERLRTEQFGHLEAGSRRVTQALADVAEVLTPEQRRKLADTLERGQRWRGWHRS